MNQRQKSKLLALVANVRNFMRKKGVYTGLSKQGRKCYNGVRRCFGKRKRSLPAWKTCTGDSIGLGNT